MKKNLSQKLSLNKETIAHLSKEDSGRVLGGASAGITCTGPTYTCGGPPLTCCGEACFPTGSPCPIPRI